MVFLLASLGAVACGASDDEPPSDASADGAAGSESTEPDGAAGAPLVDTEGPAECSTTDPWSLEQFCALYACPSTPAEAEASIMASNCGFRTTRSTGCGR